MSRLPLLAILFSLLLPWEARAQTVTLSRSGFTIVREQQRSSGAYPYWINRKDCLDDDDSLGSNRTQIQMTPTLTQFNNNMNLEVWVANSGVDCLTVAERQPTNGRCSLVHSSRAVLSGQTFTVSPRDVVEALRDPRGGSVIGEGTRESCDFQIQNAIIFYLMLVQGGNVQGTAAQWKDNTSVDTFPPLPATALEVSGGTNRLFPEWTLPSTDEATDTLGFRFYCEQVGGGGSSVGGASGQGGAGSGDCGASRLVAGAIPDNLEELECGSATGRTSRSGEARVFTRSGAQLQNGVTYAIAVSPEDQVFNRGRLSPIACGTPEEVNTFFDAYVDSGGRGGGGFFSCGWGRSSGSGLFGAFLTLALVALARRRSSAA